MSIINKEDEKILEKIKNENDICGYVRVDKFKLLVFSILFLILVTVTFVGNIIDKNTVGIVSDGLFMILLAMTTIEHIVELKKLKNKGQ